MIEVDVNVDALSGESLTEALRGPAGQALIEALRSNQPEVGDRLDVRQADRAAALLSNFMWDLSPGLIDRVRARALLRGRLAGFGVGFGFGALVGAALALGWLLR